MRGSILCESCMSSREDESANLYHSSLIAPNNGWNSVAIEAVRSEDSIGTGWLQGAFSEAFVYARRTVTTTRGEEKLQRRYAMLAMSRCIA